MSWLIFHQLVTKWVNWGEENSVEKTPPSELSNRQICQVFSRLMIDVGVSDPPLCAMISLDGYA